MHRLITGSKWLAALMLAVILAASAQAMSFSFAQGQGLASDYVQYGPWDTVVVTHGPFSPATQLAYDNGPPYQLRITVNTNVAKNTYSVGAINSIDWVYVTIY